jgi:hypothetical protein
LSTDNQQWAAALAEHGVTAAESALLCAVHYGITTPPEDLPRHAAGENYSLAGPNTAEECRAALDACLDKGWLQVIDEAALQEIRDDIRRGQVVGPIYRLPAVGCVDFTHRGADLWHRLGGESSQGTRRKAFAYTDVVHSKTVYYFRSRAAALREAEELRGWPGIVSLPDPSPVGPWRVQWWRLFPEGYRLDVEERHPWEGRCPHQEGWHQIRDERWAHNPRRLRHILDCHNVGPVEWLHFAAMDRYHPHWPNHLIRCPPARDEERFGITASEPERRQALEDCLRNGWLRATDGAKTAEVHALLADGGAMVPVPRASRCSRGEIDFTPAGAALYRMIGAEYLGPDWEDEVSVYKEHYREEHRYCETEEGLGGIVKEYEDTGEVVRASRLIPLGPWCVYWWRRFPQGYRLELEIDHR